LSAADFGGGTATFTVANQLNAFRFRYLGPGIDEVFELGSWRFWVDTSGNLRIKGLDPAFGTDGFSLGPGVFVGTFASLPVSPPVGTMVQCTDVSPFTLAWGDIVAVGGFILSRFLIWNGTNWTVIGV
jgi:hypothetical protein